MLPKGRFVRAGKEMKRLGGDGLFMGLFSRGEMPLESLRCYLRHFCLGKERETIFLLIVAEMAHY